MIENIERIEKPPRDVFYRDYILAQRPVIITDLFAEEPIRELATLEAARARLGEMPVKILESYEDSFVRLVQSISGLPNFERRGGEGTVNEYLRRVEADPSTRIICSEVPDSHFEALRELYTIPDLVDGAEMEQELWLANKGNYSHFHWDDDHRNVLQYNLFGRKRFLLMEPRHSKKLLPIQNNCMISPEGMSDEENDAFVRFIDGRQCVLQPGEALFMPALMWHAVEYLDTSMAVSFRFWRNRFNKFLAKNVVADYKQQALGWKLINEPAIDPDVRAAFDEVEATCRRQYASPFDKGEAITNVMAAVFDRVCTDELPGRYGRPFADVWKGAIDKFTFFGYAFMNPTDS